MNDSKFLPALPRRQPGRPLVRHSQRKRGAMDRPNLRNHGASPRPYRAHFEPAG